MNYIVEFLIKKQAYFFVWHTSEESDGFVLNEGKPVCFTDKIKLSEYCKDVNQEESIYDLDILSCKILSGNIFELSCSELNDYWNIFSDMAKSISEDFIGDKKKFDNIYNKLFFGCNLTTINTSSEKYIPEWSEEEKKSVCEILLNGIEIILKAREIK